MENSTVYVVNSNPIINSNIYNVGYCLATRNIPPSYYLHNRAVNDSPSHYVVHRNMYSTEAFYPSLNPAAHFAGLLNY